MKWRTEATPAQKAEAIAGIEGLTELIPEIRALSVGTDAGLREGNFDLAAVVDFEDRASYEVYSAHPDHLDMIAEVLRPILSERAAVQYTT